MSGFETIVEHCSPEALGEFSRRMLALMAESRDLGALRSHGRKPGDDSAETQAKDALVEAVGQLVASAHPTPPAAAARGEGA